MYQKEGSCEHRKREGCRVSQKEDSYEHRNKRAEGSCEDCKREGCRVSKQREAVSIAKDRAAVYHKQRKAVITEKDTNKTRIAGIRLKINIERGENRSNTTNGHQGRGRCAQKSASSLRRPSAAAPTRTFQHKS